MEGTEGSAVVADVAALAAVAQDAQHAEAVIENVIENAQARIETAERNAEQIAAAAMESARGQEIENLRKDIFEWRNEQHQLRDQLQDLSSQMQTLAGQVSALGTLQLSQQSPASPSLTLPTSETVEQAITDVQEIIPASLSESVVAESPVPVAAPKRKRWI